MGTVHNKNSRKPQFTQQCPQPSLMWSDTIFPGQPKHIPNSLRGKKQVGGGVRDQTWEHVAGEGKRELGRAGREKQKKNVRNRKSLQSGERTEL